MEGPRRSLDSHYEASEALGGVCSRAAVGEDVVWSFRATQMCEVLSVACTRGCRAGRRYGFRTLQRQQSPRSRTWGFDLRINGKLAVLPVTSRVS